MKAAGVANVFRRRRRDFQQLLGMIDSDTVEIGKRCYAVLVLKDVNDMVFAKVEYLSDLFKCQVLLQICGQIGSDVVRQGGLCLGAV